MAVEENSPVKSVMFLAYGETTSTHAADVMDREFALFDCKIRRRGRTWRWRVVSEWDEAVMHGTETSRPAAQYKAARAMFQLMLTAPYWSRVNSTHTRHAGRAPKTDRPLLGRRSSVS